MIAANIDLQVIAKRRIGINIARARRADRRTQQCLADECGVTRGTIGHLESGDRLPSLGTLIRIAEVLGCDLSQLTEGVHVPRR